MINRLEKRELRPSYTKTYNSVLRDTDLPLSARGLLTTMLSFPNHWEFHYSTLARYTKENRQTIARIIKKYLVPLGYIEREKVKGANGFPVYLHIVYPMKKEKWVKITKESDKEFKIL